jgi:hypothetical protein
MHWRLFATRRFLGIVHALCPPKREFRNQRRQNVNGCCRVIIAPRADLLCNMKSYRYDLLMLRLHQRKSLRRLANNGEHFRRARIQKRAIARESLRAKAGMTENYEVSVESERVCTPTLTADISRIKREQQTDSTREPSMQTNVTVARHWQGVDACVMSEFGTRVRSGDEVVVENRIGLYLYKLC